MTVLVLSLRAKRSNLYIMGKDCFVVSLIAMTELNKQNLNQNIMAKYPLHPKAIENSKEKNSILKNDFSMLYQNPKALICRDCEECSAYKKNLGQTSIQFQKSEYCHVTKDLIKDAIKKPCPKAKF